MQVLSEAVRRVSGAGRSLQDIVLRASVTAIRTAEFRDRSRYLRWHQ